MAEKYQTPKGFRDFLPDTASKRNLLLEKLKTAINSYGFEVLETPAVEYAEVLKGKYGDEEKLIFEFEDRGGRKVALRYDQTVPLARVVASNHNLPIPFKRLQIQNVWRAENPQKGRFREFLQVDFDTVGTYSLVADAEIIAAAITAAKSLGIKNFVVKINDRDSFSGFSVEVIRSIDKLKKIGETGVLEQIKREGYDDVQAKDILKRIQETSPTKKIQELFELLKDFGVESDKYAFDPTLARGLDYYTGAIYEMEIEGYQGGSVGSGGRYDNLVGKFSGQKTPAVGFSFGIDRLVDALSDQGLLPPYSPNVKVLVTIFEEALTKKSLDLANKLREQGINTEIYLERDAKLEKQLKYANNKKIPFVAILGPEEINQGVITLKEMSKETQSQLRFFDLVKKLR